MRKPIDPNSTPAPRASQEPADSHYPGLMHGDGIKYKHTSLCIETLIELDNSNLLVCCQPHPQGVNAIRQALLSRQAQGKAYLVTKSCANVGPKGDCLGHIRIPETYLAVIDGVLQWTADEPGAENWLAMMNRETPVPEEHFRQ